MLTAISILTHHILSGDYKVIFTHVLSCTHPIILKDGETFKVQARPICIAILHSPNPHTIW